MNTAPSKAADYGDRGDANRARIPARHGQRPCVLLRRTRRVGTARAARAPRRTRVGDASIVGIATSGTEPRLLVGRRRRRGRKAESAIAWFESRIGSGAYEGRCETAVELAYGTIDRYPTARARLAGPARQALRLAERAARGAGVLRHECRRARGDQPRRRTKSSPRASPTGSPSRRSASSRIRSGGHPRRGDAASGRSFEGSRQARRRVGYRSSRARSDQLGTTPQERSAPCVSVLPEIVPAFVVAAAYRRLRRRGARAHRDSRRRASRRRRRRGTAEVPGRVVDKPLGPTHLSSPVIADVNGDGHLDVAHRRPVGHVCTCSTAATATTSRLAAAGAGEPGPDRRGGVEPDRRRPRQQRPQARSSSAPARSTSPASKAASSRSTRTVRCVGASRPMTIEGESGVVGTPAVGDVNGDGFPDVVFGSFDHRIYVVNRFGGALARLPDGHPRHDLGLTRALRRGAHRAHGHLPRRRREPRRSVRPLSWAGIMRAIRVTGIRAAAAVVALPAPDLPVEPGDRRTSTATAAWSSWSVPAPGRRAMRSRRTR